ncbi:MAG: glycosyltransferase [Acidimicrobiales bacterium]
MRFLGFTRNDLLPELYANALAVPFIPYDEDLGLITLEAFSQGTAVVTCSDSGGPTEFIKDGVTGLVAEPNAASIGAALAKLVNDPELARKLGQAGKERGERIVWEDVVDALLGEERYTPEEQAARAAEAARAADEAAAAASPDRVVVLTTFAIDDPGHGGQIRARNLYGTLARHRPVEVVALVDFGQQPSHQVLEDGLTQVVVPRSAEHHVLAQEQSIAMRTPVSDLVAGSHIELTPAYLEAVRRAARGASALILAEPYLLPVVEALDLDLPVLYDAYNVEAQLKADVYPDTDLGRELLAQVVAVEARAVRRADGVTTCSTADAAALAEESGRPADAFVVVPNGTAVPDAVPTAEERAAAGRRWCHRYWTAGSMGAEPEHLAVFFGSWHPPNLDAVELLVEVAEALPSLLIVSAGRHGQAFEHRSVPANLVFAGAVSMRAKDRLLGAAHVALNPMRIGSGTNLKLLEYLAMGVPVVSTPFGARGIDVVDGEHLRFADPGAFADAVAEVLADPAGAATRATAARSLVAERYAWSALGGRLAALVDDLVAARAPK